MALTLKPSEIIEKNEYQLLVKHESWNRIYIADIAIVQNGYAFKSELFTKNIGTPLIRIRDINSSSTENFYNGEYDEAFLVNHGDILIGMDGDFNCSMWKGNAGLLNQRVCRIIVNEEKYSKKFFYFAIQPYLNAINAETSAITVKHLSSATIREIPLPFPPLEEQHRIVEKIESLFSELDNSVANLKAAKAQLKRYRQSVLKSAVEGRLVENEASLAKKEKRSFQHSKDLILQITKPSRPNRYSTRSKDVIVGHGALAVGSPKINLPDGWVWISLIDIARMESGHTPSRKHSEWWDGDISWIGIKDARENHGKIIYQTIQHTNEEGLINSAARLLPIGTVCISRTASVGYVVIMGKPMATSQDFVNFVPSAAVTSDWLKLIFMADREALIRFGKGTVHKTIYFPEWLSMHIGLPPLVEQERIVMEVNYKLSEADVMEQTIDESIIKAEKMRQSILKKAFEGKLC